MVRDIFSLVGTAIDGKYRVDEIVGEGGFGVVYRGHHLSFEKPIAVKCLKVPPHFTPEAARLFRERFREEGKLLFSLSDHPSVVHVLDFGLIGGHIPYLVLEWLEGNDLSTIFADNRTRGLPPLDEMGAVQLLAPAIDALSLAHSLKLAHRDIKPANLFRAQTPRGMTLKVLDFGIAKAMQEGETATQLSTRTSSGFSAFSPAYGAPEQFHAKRFGPTGPWTDVHGLGLILVELVTGRSAYDGDEQAEWYEAAVRPLRPTPRVRGANVSDFFEAICARALAIRPADRFPDAGALLAALQPMLSARSSQATPEPPRISSNVGQQAPGAWSPVATPGAVAMTPTPRLSPTVGSGTELVQPVQTRSSASGPYGNQFASPPTPPQYFAPPPVPRRGVQPLLYYVAGAVALLAMGIPLVCVATRDKTVKQPTLTSTSATASVSTKPVPTVDPQEEVARLEREKLVGEMVRLPAGTVHLGFNGGEADERPEHDVSLAPFSLDQHEVTVEAWRLCEKEKGCPAAPTEVASPTLTEQEKKFGQFCNGRYSDRGKHPINCVTWDEATQFCTWAGKRLPTESEWEYAALGATMAPSSPSYPWGQGQPNARRTNACGKECVDKLRSLGLPSPQPLYPDSDGFEATAPVGSFALEGDTPQGLTDLGGNVSEWVSDLYKPYAGTVAAGETRRVNRGGNWLAGNDPKTLRVTKRWKDDMKVRDAIVGFRCARSTMTNEGSK